MNVSLLMDEVEAAWRLYYNAEYTDGEPDTRPDVDRLCDMLVVLTEVVRAQGERLRLLTDSLDQSDE